MKALLKEFGYGRLIALALVFLPLIILPILGALWLWQAGAFLYWVSILVLCGAGGYGVHWLGTRREKEALDGATTTPDPNWSPSAEQAWAEVEALASEAMPERWPLSDPGGLWRLGRDTLATVANHYHPQREKPLLELTVPHTLLIIERASRELRQQISENVPLSHRLTLGHMARLKQLKQTATRLENAYRLGYAVLDPSSVVFREFRREMGNRILGYGSEQVQTWLLQEYVRKVGFYAIELYSGKLLLETDTPTESATQGSRRMLDQADADEASDVAEPIRVLVLGRSGSGRSSLINQLLGELRAPTDRLPGTTREVSGYRWQLEDEAGALIIDTPGLESDALDAGRLRSEVDSADLVLWVTAANKPDRDTERQWLDRVRGWFEQDDNRRAPPVIVAVSHIDRLRPVREWAPPYDLNNESSAKVASIRAALAAVGEQLDVAADHLVPVCLAEDRAYNVEDALLAVILEHLDEARRVRFLRCVRARRSEENWAFLRRQLVNTGRLLVDLPQRL